MRQFFRIFMELYLINYLSQHPKLDIILCVDYMLNTNVKKKALVQHIFIMVGLYSLSLSLLQPVLHVLIA